MASVSAWTPLRRLAASSHHASPARRLFGFPASSWPREPPLVPARPATRSCGSQEWQDEYSWLEEGGPKVQQVLDRERRYAQRWLARCTPLAAQLRREMLAELPAEKVSAPERVGAHEYFVRQVHGQLHPCYMRRRLGGSAEGSAAEEVVLDVNELAAVHGEYVQVGQMKLSRCGQRVAFTLDSGSGEESFAGFTRDLTTRALRHLGALGSVATLEWAADGRTLLATQPNELGRPWRVVACDTGGGSQQGGATSLGSSWAVFEEADERFFVDLGRTKDWSFLTINCNSKASSEVHLLPVDLPAGHWWLSGSGSGSGSGTAQSASAPAAAARSALQLEPRLVQARQPGLEYFVEHNGGYLYILSNARGADNYALYRVPAFAPSLGQEHWHTVMPKQPGIAIEDIDMYRNWLVLYLRHRGRQQVAALPLEDGLPAVLPVAAAADSRAAARTHATQPADAAAALASGEQQPAVDAVSQLAQAPLPPWALSVVAGANADFDAASLRLQLSSPVHPEVAFDWELGGQRLVSLSGEQQVAAPQPQAAEGSGSLPAAGARGAAAADGPPAGNSLEQRLGSQLGWQQLWARSADGTQVPLTLAGHLPAGLAGHASVDNNAGSGSGSSRSSGSSERQPVLLEPRPCLLVVYGSYGHNLPTEFLAERLPLLRRDWLLALAHVRGGGELGRRWHAAGRGVAKHNSVDDLEACLDLLLSTGLTRSGLVALEAHSAGGLTAGMLLNRRPADVGAALLEAPFVDVLSAMSRPELPLTEHEYEEWGDPRQADQWEQIRRVCPYQTVRTAAYPPVLLTCSQSDLRVPFWGPLKYAARLRSAVSAAEGAERGSGASSVAAGRPGGPILLMPDAQAGHFVHERDLLDTKAEELAFLVAAIRTA